MHPFEQFTHEKLTKIFTEKNAVLDIGGGLRISTKQGNRFDPKRAWIRDLATKVEYRIMDPVPDFNPDIVGDIHHMPFPDNSLPAIICESVLEHVEDPIRAAQELYRTLTPGGYCFVYVPFLYYYHAERGYYKDYWRFTKDALEYMFRDFKNIEIQAVRGPLETWMHLNPFTQHIEGLGRTLDKWMKKTDSHQVSGYSVFLIK